MKHSYSRSTTRVNQQGEAVHSLDDYRKDKLFPHISDQYNFRINNRILLAKIINPRRDKTIMDSLMQTTSKYGFKRRKAQTKSNKRNLNKRNHTAELVHPTQFKPQKQISPSQKERGSHLSNDRRTTPIVQQQFFEKEKEIEENCQQSFQNRKESRVPKEKNNCYRNNYVGKIMRNTGTESRLLDQSSSLDQKSAVFNCDLSVSFHMKSGRICRNANLDSCRAKISAKIRRMPRGMLKEHFQSKENDPFTSKEMPCH